MTKSTKDERPRDRMDWDDVRVFAVVADTGGINKAAQVLKVTPGMVSRRIDDLEARLDVKLFNRSAAGMTLTPAGEDVRDKALSMQRFASAIEGSARSRDRKEEGPVSIAAPDGLTSYWIAPRAAEFLNLNPKIQLTLDCGFWSKESADGIADITISADKTVARTQDVISPLAVLHYVFVASPKYLDIYGTPKSAASAAGDHRTLKHVAQTFQRENWSKRASAVEALSTFSIETNSSGTLVTAVATGSGIATLPSYFCHLYPDLVLIEDMSTPIQLWLTVRHEVAHSLRVQRVVKWLERMFDTKTNPWFRDEFVHPSAFAAEVLAAPSRAARESATDQSEDDRRQV